MPDFKVTVTLQEGTNDPEQVAQRTYADKDLVEDKRFQLSVATAVLWDPTANGQALSDFELLILTTDSDVNLELGTDVGGANEEFSSVTLAANVPFMLGSDVAFGNYTNDVFAGILDSINQIRAQETAGNTANVRLRAYS